MKGIRTTKGMNTKPFDKMSKMNAKKAFAKTKSDVMPVAKDTNKTRRKMVKPTKGKM